MSPATPRLFSEGMNMSKSDRNLTHLESTALGIVWKHGGCTAYEVMTQFSGSLTSQFKSGAGSTYPLMKRLHADGFVKQKLANRGRQEKAVYTITAKGRRALAKWLSPPLPDVDIGLGVDPIRSRVYFLGLLPLEKQKAFLNETLKRLTTELQSTETSSGNFRDSGNQYGALAMIGAVAVTKARIRWLKEVRKRIEQLALGKGTGPVN